MAAALVVRPWERERNLNKTRDDEEDLDRLIPLAQAARMLGLSSDAIRKRLAGTENLTLIDQSSSGASRHFWFLVRSEVFSHRQRLIDEARRRTDVDRFFIKNSRRKS